MMCEYDSGDSRRCEPEEYDGDKSDTDFPNVCENKLEFFISID